MKQYKYKINGKEYNVTVNSVEDNIANLEVNGKNYQVELEKKEEVKIAKPVVARPAAKSAAKAEKAEAPASSGSKSGVKSPLPGVILELKVKVGDVVKKGQTILILEAMKMENNITADKDGTITDIKVNKGDSVLEGNVLVIIQ